MKRDFKFYIVDAVCGHVGRKNYVIKSFCVEAMDAKEAATRGRSIPRVKHDYKYAIQNVREVSLQAYVIQKLKNEFDPYMHVTNRADQDRYCEDLEVARLEDLDGNKVYKRTSKVGRKKYVNNYLPDDSDMEEYKYVS